jgi:hypothetical protein
MDAIGPGATNLTIIGGGLFHLFTVRDGASVTMSGLTLTVWVARPEERRAWLIDQPRPWALVRRVDFRARRDSFVLLRGRTE